MFINSFTHLLSSSLTLSFLMYVLNFEIASMRMATLVLFSHAFHALSHFTCYLLGGVCGSSRRLRSHDERSGVP